MECWNKKMRSREAPLSLLGGYFGLTIDIVAWSQEEKCGLKYVMFTFGRMH